MRERGREEERERRNGAKNNIGRGFSFQSCNIANWWMLSDCSERRERDLPPAPSLTALRSLSRIQLHGKQPFPTANKPNHKLYNGKEIT
jgi:hypothetical protein